MRQSPASAQSWISLVQGSSTTQVTVTSSDLAAGTYQTQLESYDASSVNQATLFTDTITLIVSEFEVVSETSTSSDSSAVSEISRCAVSNEVFEEIKTDLSDRVIYLSYPAGVEGSAYKSFYVYWLLIMDSLGYDDFETMQLNMGPLNTKVFSWNPNLKLGYLGTDPIVSLTSNNFTEPSRVVGGYMEFAFNGCNSWNLTVDASYTASCIIERVYNTLVTRNYTIGSGIKKLELPVLDQKPSCGLPLKLKFQYVDAISSELVNSVQFDEVKQLLTIDYDNFQEDPSESSATIHLISEVNARAFVKVNLLKGIESDVTEASHRHDTSLMTLDDLNNQYGIEESQEPAIDLFQRTVLDMDVEDLSTEQIFMQIPLLARLMKGQNYIHELIAKQRNEVAQ